MESNKDCTHFPGMKINEKLILSLQTKISEFLKSSKDLRRTFSVWKDLRRNTIESLKVLNSHNISSDSKWLTYSLFAYQFGSLVGAVYSLKKSYVIAITQLIISEAISCIARKAAVKCIWTKSVRCLNDTMHYMDSDYTDTKQFQNHFEKQLYLLQDIEGILQKTFPGCEEGNCAEKETLVDFDIAMEHIDQWVKKRDLDEILVSHLRLLKHQCIQHHKTLTHFLNDLICEHLEPQVNELKTIILKILKENSYAGIVYFTCSLAKRFWEISRESQDAVPLTASNEMVYVTTEKYSEISKKWRDLEEVLVKDWMERIIQQLENSLRKMEEYFLFPNI